MIILMSLTLLVLLKWPHYLCVLGGTFLFPISGMMHPAVTRLCWGHRMTRPSYVVHMIISRLSHSSHSRYSMASAAV